MLNKMFFIHKYKVQDRDELLTWGAAVLLVKVPFLEAACSVLLGASTACRFNLGQPLVIGMKGARS